VKILLITSSFPSKERVAAVFLLDLIAELNNLGFEVHVLTQNCDSNKTESRTLWNECKVTNFAWKGGDIPLVSLMERPLSGVSLVMQFYLSAIKTGLRIVKKWNPDFIFAEWLIPAGFIAFMISKLTKTPYAARALGSDVLIGGEKPIIKNCLRLVARHAAVLFSDGFQLCEKTSELAGGKKCHFAPTIRSLNNRKSDFNWLNDAGFFTTCTIGRLEKVKGHIYLINAIDFLVKKGIAVRSYIVGSGREYDYLSRRIRELRLENRVILTGRLEDGDIADLLQHVDCVVIPSLSESIPLVFGEAVGARRPLIVTDAGDMKYLVGKYHLGYVVSRQESGALANAIEKMSKNPNRSQFSHDSDRILSFLSVKDAARKIAGELTRHSRCTTRMV
jgi:glycosyltransferase involved in cell wall biosynthesis